MSEADLLDDSAEGEEVINLGAIGIIRDMGRPGVSSQVRYNSGCVVNYGASKISQGEAPIFLDQEIMASDVAMYDVPRMYVS